MARKKLDWKKAICTNEAIETAKTKYLYLHVIQERTALGWEDLDRFDRRSRYSVPVDGAEGSESRRIVTGCMAARAWLRIYSEDCRPLRLIQRREFNPLHNYTVFDKIGLP